MSDLYCYDGTNTLINKFNIKDKERAVQTEKAISDLRRADLPSTKEINLESYQSIHKHLFQDCYEWAGTPRHDAPFLDGDSAFNFKHLKDGIPAASSALETLNNTVKNELSNNFSSEKLADSLGDAFSEINEAHIFREGNGRTQRALIGNVCKSFDVNFDISKLDGQAWNVASELSNSEHGNRDLIKEQIAFSIEDNPKTATLDKNETIQKLQDEYLIIDELSMMNSNSIEQNTSELIIKNIETMNRVKELPDNVTFELPDNTPKMLTTSVISDQIDKIKSIEINKKDENKHPEKADLSAQDKFDLMKAVLSQKGIPENDQKKILDVAKENLGIKSESERER